MDFYLYKVFVFLISLFVREDYVLICLGCVIILMIVEIILMRLGLMYIVINFLYVAIFLFFCVIGYKIEEINLIGVDVMFLFY